ncbi:MAG TPA: hypothetical protein VJ583_11265 [Nitrososphaeraceae archaeon]|nr:hypothetical protein [Nitrososphaeraceae archaeon]
MKSIRLIISILFTILPIVFVTTTFTYIPIFGDGLFMEELSASTAGRDLSLLIKMSPPVVTTETLKGGQNPLIQFRLSDTANNETIKHVTYLIEIEKNGKRLMLDTFHSHTGNLGIQMRPSSAEHITLYGEQDPILAAYTGDMEHPVSATGPIFAEGGLYHFIVTIETIDFDRTFLPTDKQPVFEGWLSVGYTLDKDFQINGASYPIQTISYYDALKNFTYDSSNNELQFAMPFDWNLDRLEKVNVFVHEEISIPNPSPLAANGYKGTINNIDLSPNLLMLDRTNSTKDVVHFMLTKPAVLDLAQKVAADNSKNNNQNMTNEMTFTLSPSKTAVNPGSMVGPNSMNMPMNNDGDSSGGM